MAIAEEALDSRKVLRALRAGSKANAKLSVRFADADNELVRKAKVKLR